MASAQAASPLHAFYSKLERLKTSEKPVSNITKEARNHLSSLISLYNVDLTSKFGVADFDPRSAALKGNQVKAAEYISAYLWPSRRTSWVCLLNATRNSRLLEVGIPQLISYQLRAGALCHNSVAKQMNQSLAKITLA